MMEIFEAIEEEVEELFPPKPGGLVDRHRKNKAAKEAAQKEAENAHQAIEGPAYKAIKVAPESPESLTAHTITIASDATAQVLPASPYRYRATVRLVTAASTVILARDSGAALGGNGYIMLSADPPLVIYSRGQLYAFNDNGGSIQVSVVSEYYDPQ